VVPAALVVQAFQALFPTAAIPAGQKGAHQEVVGHGLVAMLPEARHKLLKAHVLAQACLFARDPQALQEVRLVEELAPAEGLFSVGGQLGHLAGRADQVEEAHGWFLREVSGRESAAWEWAALGTG